MHRYALCVHADEIVVKTCETTLVLANELRLSKLPSRSRGTSMRTEPLSVMTVLALVSLRWLLISVPMARSMKAFLKFWKMSSNCSLVTGPGLRFSSISLMSCGTAALPLAAAVLTLRCMSAPGVYFSYLAHIILTGAKRLALLHCPEEREGRIAAALSESDPFTFNTPLRRSHA
jgi:hypothetical protein